MKRKKTGIKVAERIGLAVLITALIVLIAAILFPVFTKPDGRPVGEVLDGANKPMPGAVLRFRNGRGQIVAVLTADDNGQFRRSGLSDLTRSTTMDGFALTRITHNTGSGKHFLFSPLGTQAAVVHDTRGRPIANVDVIFRPDGPTQAARPDELDAISGQDGVAFIQSTLGTRYELDCWNPKWAISHVQTVASPSAVRYEVTVVPAATISGRLVGSNGKPLDHFTILAEQIPWTQNTGFVPHRTTVNYRGRFRLSGLRPGTYQISASPVGSQALGPESFFATDFTVNSGQTIELSLRYDEDNGAEAASLNPP